MDEKSKVALISGGTSGIGLATAKILLQRQWRVAICGRSQSRGKRALAELGGEDRAAFFPADVSDDEACRAVVSAVVGRYGRLDGLVTSAGYYEECLLEDTTAEQVQAMFAVNVFGTISLCRYALPHLKKSRGAIVTVSSDAGIQGNVACSLYGATKGAVVAFTKSLALEAAPHQVRVNCICPGDVDTPLLEEQLRRTPGLTKESLREQYPLFRLARADEIGKAAAFLLGDDASFITAVALPVDGGLTSW